MSYCFQKQTVALYTQSIADRKDLWNIYTVESSWEDTIEFITTISKHSMMNQSATPTSTQPDRPWRIMQA